MGSLNQSFTNHEPIRCTQATENFTGWHHPGRIRRVPADGSLAGNRMILLPSPHRKASNSASTGRKVAAEKLNEVSSIQRFYPNRSLTYQFGGGP